MKKHLRFSFLFFLLYLLTLLSPAQAITKEVVLYDFERDPQGWTLPDWALAKKDYVGEEIGISEFYASRNRYSLEFKVNFPGGPNWKAAYTECPVDIQDWSDYSWLELDLLLPEGASVGLRAKVILTVGEEWKWCEMNKATKLEPGEWTVIKLDLRPGSQNWRFFVTDEFRRDVKKIGVRIESSNGIIYKGPIYIDNIKLSQE